jgi:DNA-binding helix-hairpin-helix protein with protein kinase domain
MKAELAIWRDDAIDRFRSDATVRWRRSTTHQVLDQFSWEAGVNPSVQVPKRVHRVMGTRLASATVQTHERLVKLINDTLVRRLGVWSDEVERIGSFRPGELLAAADRLEASG